MAPLSELSGQKKLLVAAIACLALVALGVSSYLTWVTWQQSTVAGCTGGSGVDCDEVLTSGWSKWLGMPVSLLGAITYVGILALVIPAAMFGGWAMTMLLTLAMTAAGAAAWFIGTQAFILEHFCLYCMAVHCCGLLICGAVILLFRSAGDESHFDHMSAYFGGQQEVVHQTPVSQAYQPLIAAALASIGLAGLIGGQMLFAPSGMEIVESTPLEVVETSPAESEPVPTTSPPVADPQPSEQPSDPVAATDSADDYDRQIAELFPEESAPESEPLQDPIADGPATKTTEKPTASTETPAAGAPRYFRFSSLPKQIDAADNPVIGNPYAECRFVEMMDYTCPHCRKLNLFIQSAIARYGDQLGFVIYHVPLSRKCNQLVKMDQSMHENACDYARLAYSVWKIAPKKFAEYHDWLMEGKKAPPLFDAKQKAMQLAGEAVLIDKSLAVESNERVVDHASQLEPLRVGLPVLVFDGGIVRGMPDTEAQWFQMLEQRMGLKPPANVTN